MNSLENKFRGNRDAVKMSFNPKRTSLRKFPLTMKTSATIKTPQIAIPSALEGGRLEVVSFDPMVADQEIIKVRE